jgi:hypothetical protein
LLNDDHKWNNTNYLLSNYKTKKCENPHDLCRLGVDCPKYHSACDKRRDPNIFTYRPTACSKAKKGDDWLETFNCEKDDNCEYCHSKTEQQFHSKVRVKIFILFKKKLK